MVLTTLLGTTRRNLPVTTNNYAIESIATSDIGIGITTKPTKKDTTPIHDAKNKGVCLPPYDDDDDECYSGRYELVERHVGDAFLHHYDFYAGMDSGGSAGSQEYVGLKRAKELNLIRISGRDDKNNNDDDNDDDGDGEEHPFVILSASAASLSTTTRNAKDSDGTTPTTIQSLRLEGKRRFDRGLIVLDVDHVPNGCGVWPAFWTTDESSWPRNGEIDILETFNGRRTAKTTLHTSEHCAMRYGYGYDVYGDDSETTEGNERIEYTYPHTYRQPKRSEWTGHWEQSMPIPDWYCAAGLPLRGERRRKHNNSKGFLDLANDCWIHVPHDWANQGCVVDSNVTDSVGKTRNQLGGGIYVMEWDPANGYIRSWVFGRQRQRQRTASATKDRCGSHGGTIKTIPDNLRLSLKHGLKEDDFNDGVNVSNEKNSTQLDPSKWGRPYSHFVIGRNSSCSADHFANHRIVINLAFCGKVSGNLFAQDCPKLYEEFSKIHNDNKDEYVSRRMSPKEACESYLDSDIGRKMVEDEAYWKIRGVYLYQRTKEER